MLNPLTGKCCSWEGPLRFFQAVLPDIVVRSRVDRCHNNKCAWEELLIETCDFRIQLTCAYIKLINVALIERERIIDSGDVDPIG